MLQFGYHRFLTLMVALVVCCANSSAAESGVNLKTPNIVLIMADDLGWKDLHCYGNKKLDTPHIDRLAEQGMLFTDAYSAAPVCTPTRAALMTGESPARLNITNHAAGHAPNFQKPGTKLITPLWLRHLPLERVTLAEQLKSAGYATGFVGKWHLSHRSRSDLGADGKLPTEAELRPEHQGFDVNVGGCSYGGPPSYFSPYRIPNLEGKADGEYLPDRSADESIEFIKSAQADGNRPFFLCWWNYSVHYPFQAPADLIAKYEKRKGPGIENPTYAAMIEGMDLAIGRLLSALKKMGLEEDTLVIFTSDNGGFAGVSDCRPLRESKGYLYEGGIRVPLIVSWPGQVPKGKLCKTPVISMDFYPTFLELAALKPSGKPIDGESLLPLFRQSGKLSRQTIFFHFPNYAWHMGNRLAGAVREGKWKMIRNYDDGSLELYDLQDDISEKRNLAEQNPVIAKNLNQKLSRWLVKTNAPMPPNISR